MIRLPKKRKKIVSKPFVWTKKDTYRTLGILFLLAIVCISIIGGFEFLRNKKIKEYSGITIGVILTIQDNEFNSQDFEGGRIKIVSYTINYQYRVGNKEYIESNTLPYRGKYIKLYGEIYTGSKLKIGYKENQPEESIIMIQ